MLRVSSARVARGPVCLALFVVAALAVPDAATSDPARAFLAEAFTLSPRDIASIDGGQVLTRTLDVKNGREVATLGIVRASTTPDAYILRLLDIVSFKRTDDVLQIGTFGLPPQLSDIESLTLEKDDLEQLRDCRVKDCKVRLSADAIERVRREIDWRSADGPGRASQLVRQILVDYVARYQVSGADAAMEYADTASGLNVGREFASLVAGDPTTSKYLPEFRRHLLEYPARGTGESDFIYWSKERVHRRPVVSITHVAIAEPGPGSPVSFVVGSKQIYAMHYFDASLGLTLLVRDPTVSSPATFVVYLNRSRIDLFDGIFGGVARRIVMGRARSLVGEQLARLQRTLAEGNLSH